MHTACMHVYTDINNECRASRQPTVVSLSNLFFVRSVDCKKTQNYALLYRFIKNASVS